MKYELKLNYEDLEVLKQGIEKTYFQMGDRGKMLGQRVKFPIEKDSPNWIVLTGLNNMTCKIENDQIIDGTLRCTIEDDGEQINLLPCSIYCVMEGEKYSFY
jgi:hypothetical protein